jgi:hypothetical protein
MPDDRSDTVVLSEAEWQAVLLGARAMREVAAGYRAYGQTELAAECDDHVTVLLGLAMRATVAASRDTNPAVPEQQTGAELEAER